MSDLNQKKCVPCEGGVPKLDQKQASSMLRQISNEWKLANEANEIQRDFKFKGFYKTIAFVNAIAWMANHEGHHPDLEVGYNHCLVRYTTHAVDGLTENDFICAAKIDVLYDA